MKTISLKQANAETDIALINQYALKELKPEDVYVFSVILCDNEVDRDFEKFADSALDELVPLFEGKTGIFNHSWDAKDQISRIYSVGVKTTGEKNSLGEPLRQLQAFAYILRNDSTKGIIENIEGGILKEVSVGFSVKEIVCSICGSKMGWSMCEEGHAKGKIVDDALCYGILKSPTDAYEFSFVAVPAQRGAGVTKKLDKALDAQWGAFLSALDEYEPKETAETIKRFVVDLQARLLPAKEKELRQDIILRNQKYLNKQEDLN